MQLKTDSPRASRTPRSRRLTTLGLATLLFCGLAGCTGVPLPEDKWEYAGLWRGGKVTLEIFPEGQVRYQKLIGSSGHTRVNGPIKKYDGDDFITEVLFVSNRFRVDRPPFQDDGRWWMVVDGVMLKRLE